MRIRGNCSGFCSFGRLLRHARRHLRELLRVAREELGHRAQAVVLLRRLAARPVALLLRGHAGPPLGEAHRGLRAREPGRRVLRRHALGVNPAGALVRAARHVGQRLRTVRLNVSGQPAARAEDADVAGGARKVQDRVARGLLQLLRVVVRVLEDARLLHAELLGGGFAAFVPRLGRAQARDDVDSEGVWTPK